MVVRTVMSAACVLLCGVLWAQTPSEPCIKVKFAQEKDADYRFILWGEEEGEVTFEWDNGSEETFPLHAAKTGIKGKAPGANLTIRGKISVFECSGNNLKEIDVRQMPSLTHLISRKNLNSTLDLSNNKNLKMLVLQDSPLGQLDLSHHTHIDTLIVTNNSALASLSLPVEECNLTYLACTASPRLKTLDVSKAPRLRKLEAMQTLITSYDLKNNKELTFLAVGLGRPIVELSLPTSNRIDTLMLPLAGVKALDLSQTKNLKVLVTDNNFQLKELDLSGMKQLRTLQCESNQIASLKLTETPLLENLICNNNQLKTLDLSASKNLKFLICHTNQLSALDLSTCPMLQELDCSYNESLNNLVLPSSMTSLNCSNCALDGLNLNNLTCLMHLDCNDNRIISLPLTSLTKMVGLNCSNNPIEELDTEQMRDLLDITANKTAIKKLNLSNSPNLRYVSIKETAMDACALDDLYLSLRTKRPEDDQNDLGGLLLFNDNPGVAEISTTSIATKKGWMVSVVGDGGGCERSVVSVEKGNSIEVYSTSGGWYLTHIPSDVLSLSLVDMEGKVLKQYTVEQDGEVFVEAPYVGVFVIVPEQETGFVVVSR